VVVVLRRTEDIEFAKKMHAETFPADDWPGARGAHWVAWDGDKPVGYCSARPTRDGHGVYLTRAGVLPCARGRGLQRRMIATRVRWARSIGATFVCTYVLLQNYPSLVNLLRSRFAFYTPNWKWEGNDVHYMIKDI
jgi:GNAT superfamily N-acetyltransferase